MQLVCIMLFVLACMLEINNLKKKVDNLTNELHSINMKYDLLKSEYLNTLKSTDL